MSKDGIRWGNLGIITLLGVLCYFFFQTELSHVILELFRWILEALEHIRIE